MPPNKGLIERVASRRALASRSLELIAGALDYARRVKKQGKLPGPLLLTIRAANELARRILEQPSPTPTPAQRLTLLAAGAQLRALTSRIIISAECREPHSVEAELSELIQRTLTLIDRVTQSAPAIQTDRDPARTGQVIDTEAWPVPRLPRTNEPEG